MTYSAVYFSLITTRLQNPLSDDEYGEVHHIIPKSEGGTNDKDNLVRLSAREHYIAHLLLAKIYNDWKMTSAVMYFSSNNTCHGGGRRIMTRNRLFAKMRECFARKQREKLGGKSFFVGKGEQNPMFGRDWRVGKSYEELDNDSDKFSETVAVYADIWLTDICLKKDIPAQLVMESGKVSGEINYQMGSDAAVQNVSIEALKNCGDTNLWRLYKYDMTEIKND